MIRLLGAGLLLAGGWGVSWLWGRQQRRMMEDCGSFLFAAQRMERSIRCEGRGLQELFFTLSEENSAAGCFFKQLLYLWAAQPEEVLSSVWTAACDAVPLPEEGWRIWRELGQRLGGDGESICASISVAAEELSMLSDAMRSALPARMRLSGTVSLSAAAFLAILLF